MIIWPNSTRMFPGWSPTKIVQMVLIGCICRSRGQKIGLKIAIFKNLVWNYKAHSFQNWYIASSRSSLPLFDYNNIIASPWPLTFSSGIDLGPFGPSCLWFVTLFENCILKTYFLTLRPTYATNQNHLNNLGRGPPRDLFCRVWFKRRSRLKFSLYNSI